MRITNLHIQDFRSHQDSSFDMDRLTVFRGRNGAGKSSIEQAIEMALAGHAEGTDAAGRGASNLIRLGAKKAMISVSIQNGDKQRLVQCALTATGRAVLVSDPQEAKWDQGVALAEWFKSNRRLFSCLCNNRYFVDMTDDEQAEVLASVVLPEEYEWPDWVREGFASLKLAVDWSLPAADFIKAAHKVAYEARRDRTRDLKNIRVPAGDISEADYLKEYEERLAAREAELEALVAENASLAGSASQAEATKAEAAKRLEDAERRMERDRRASAEAENDLLTKAKVKEYEATAKSAARAAELDTKIIELDTKLAGAKKLLDDVSKLGELADAEARCPTCSQSLTAEVIQALAKPIVESRNGFIEERQSAINLRKTLGNPAEAEKKLAAHRQAEKDIERAKERIKDDQAIATAAQSQLDAITNAGASQSGNAELQEKIDALREKVSRGRQMVESARYAFTLAQQIQKLTAEKQSAQDAVKLLEQLVEYFDVTVRTELLDKSTADFVAGVNAILGAWGYSCSISMNPYRFAIRFGDGFEVHLKHLSKSERYRFSVAFQVALAVVSGIGFVVVDEADILDKENSIAFYEALYDHAGLDQAIILSTDERETASPIDGVRVYRLYNQRTPGDVPLTAAHKIA